MEKVYRPPTSSTSHERIWNSKQQVILTWGV